MAAKGAKKRVNLVALQRGEPSAGFIDDQQRRLVEEGLGEGGNPSLFLLRR